ncbi:MAG: hypothetical protein A3K45_06445 [Chloroflexi bacterium RIFOXYC12_FULL_59_14]|nr:MAG: hypothetical protein A3K45_06445 [Chloroflexi bacterium RIFOXYC12_FULL_59_14]OGO76472.1 MAG: hypothetical protein A3K41_09725 [Chloroflexi bacterium RIFOXYD12_FULL_57_15]
MAKNKAHVTSLSKSRTLEEIAEFWDTHSLADYADQIREVEIEVRLGHRVDNAQITSSLRDGDLPSKQSPLPRKRLLRKERSQ